MSAAGIYAVLLAGPTIPIPIPEIIASAIESIKVTNTDGDRDGFEIIFAIGRSAQDVSDYSLLINPLLQPFNRVIILISFGAIPSVLIDGIITHKQMSPSTQPGQSRLVVTGEDITLMMDREDVSAMHPNQPDIAIVTKIIAKYVQYGLVPMAIPPSTMVVNVEATRVPSQQETDLAYIRTLARKYGYIFYVEPTAVPGVNTAYWGPKLFTGPPQKALTTNMGSENNMTSISFQYNVLEPTIVTGKIQDPFFNVELPIIVTGSLRPPLAVFPVFATSMANVRRRTLRRTGAGAAEALNEAQSQTDNSTDTVTATGTVDSLAYGQILRARRLVGLRGVGYLHDGYYYVKSVTHEIKRGDYKQSFTLVRDGLGSTTPVVNP